MTNNFHFGVIESRDDPLKLGRFRVRVIGKHTHDKTQLPTEDLPWAIQLNPSSAMNGIGETSPRYVKGTTVIVSFIDEDEQSIVIFGAVSGIPQNISKLIDTEEEPVITLSENTDDTISTQPVSESPEQVDPLSIQKTNSGNSGYNALIKAMDNHNITSKYARASVLGICDVESGFKTKAENLNYSAKGLLATFPSVFKNDQNLAKSIERKPQNIAEVIYGPVQGKGKELGNDTIGDGWRYRGRGYVQLTGKSNYKKYSTSEYDLVSNPDLLLNEDISAEVTIKYFLDRVKTQQDSPSYISSAIKAVGLNRPDILEKKLNAYSYYLGDSAPPQQTDKTSDNNSNNSDTQLFENSVGFSDPDHKYPLKDYIGEPDVNRLARGRFSGTIVDRKDRNRALNIETSTGEQWSQPISPYNAKYPFNFVRETESGHIVEFDDTPNNERIHTYHRKGTFEEIDANGSKVTRIVGDNYEIIDRNGYIYIAGESNVTVSGNINIYSKSDINIKSNGDTNVNVHGNATMNVSGDFSTNVGGTYKIKTSTFLIDAASFNLTSSVLSTTSNSRNIKSATNKETFSGRSSYRYDGDYARHIGANTYSRNNAGTDYSCPTDPSRNGDVACSSIESSSTAQGTGLGAAISPLNGSNIKYSPLLTPVRNADEVFIFESTDEDLSNAPEVENILPNITPEEPTIIKNQGTPIPASCDAIFNTETFNNGYVLHTDSTGYSWTLGKLLNGNKLKPINVKGKNYTEQEIVCNLKHLAVNILGRINEMVGRVDRMWSITSCYRNFVPPGGSATSQHLIGSAVDISIGGNNNYQVMFDWAKKFGEELVYDQLLLEFLDRSGNRINWIHLSYTPSSNRKSVMTFLNHKKHSDGLTKLV